MIPAMLAGSALAAAFGFEHAVFKKALPGHILHVPEKPVDPVPLHEAPLHSAETPPRYPDLNGAEAVPTTAFAGPCVAPTSGRRLTAVTLWAAESVTVRVTLLIA